MKFLKYFSILTLIVVLLIYFQFKPKEYIVLSGETMGTYYNIKINSSSDNKSLGMKVKEELAQINSQMSVFDPKSEISQINQAAAGEWIPISKEMSIVLKTARETWKNSDGYFDPTMGKLIDLWGFGVSQQKKNPTDDEIKQVLKYSNFSQIVFSKDYMSVKKLNADTYINLSALAKGYGVDRISNLLESLGYNNFIIDIGGEVRAHGVKNEKTDGWLVGVADPKTKENAYIVNLKDYSVATSGDYRNFHYMDGKKYSHTISPKNGKPVDHNMTSVTVFNKSCMVADALATAILAMSEEKGIEFINRNNLAVIIFTRYENNDISSYISEKAKIMVK